MSVDLAGFDAETTEDAKKSFDLLQAGEYEAIIAASEQKQNKAGTGQYLKLEFVITEGPSKGRKLWCNLNLDHPNEQTVKIARGELKRICYAVGVLKPSSSGDLHDIPMIIKVGHEKRKDTGEMQNRIKDFKKKGGAAPATSTPAAPTPGQGPKPWMKK